MEEVKNQDTLEGSLLIIKEMDGHYIRDSDKALIQVRNRISTINDISTEIHVTQTDVVKCGNHAFVGMDGQNII